MDLRTVTLTLKYKQDGIWKRSPVARASNGRVRLGFVMIAGQPVEVGEGKYDLRYYVDGKTRYVPAGRTSTESEDARCRLEKQLTATITAERAGLKVETQGERVNLRKSAQDYIHDALERGATEAALQAENVSTEFLATVKATYLAEVTRTDVFAYHKALRSRGCGERTLANKHQRMMSWFKFAGMSEDDRRALPARPKYDDKLPTIYASDQIHKLQKAADPYMKLLILLALKCGLRDQELMHAEYSDINWEAHTIRIQSKPKYGFKVKAGEERDVTLVPDVEEALRAWGKKGLILPTKKGRPNGHLLRTLKRLATRAGVNAKECSLHKFRRTFITKSLRSGIELPTMMAQAGHTDLKSTMRYMRPAEGEELRERMAKVKW